MAVTTKRLQIRDIVVQAITIDMVHVQLTSPLGFESTNQTAIALSMLSMLVTTTRPTSYAITP